MEHWQPFNDGLTAFDVHAQAGVFASLSPTTASSFRTQKTVVQSLARTSVLSTVETPTGLMTAPNPARAYPSPYIPRSSSLVFHPLEMLYGVGSPDGTGAWFNPVSHATDADLFNYSSHAWMFTCIIIYCPDLIGLSSSTVRFLCRNLPSPS